MSGKKYDVFLSYSRANRRSVKKLAEKLRGADIHCFLDEWSIPAGDPWQEALVNALKGSRSCAVVIGSSGPGPWTRMEIQLALQLRQKDKTFRVIPLLLPKAKIGAIPDFLTNFNWVDFRSGLEDSAAFRSLLSGIRGEKPDPSCSTVVESRSRGGIEIADTGGSDPARRADTGGLPPPKMRPPRPKRERNL